MNKYLLLIIIILLALSSTTSYVNAVDNTFIVQTIVTGGPVIPPTPATTTIVGNKSGSKILLIENISIATSLDSGIVSFNTTQPAQAKVFWGETINYEAGSISGMYYGFDHSIKISALSKDTKYYYRIEVVNRSGITVFAEGSFKTQKDIISLPPSNVTHFQAIPQENSIALLWNIPRDRDIDLVRIVKSEKFFPRDPNDGEIIFEGNSESYTDESVLEDVMYYYAIFTKNSNGEYSSGVLAQAKLKSKGQILVPPTYTDPFIGIKVLQNVHPIIRDLKFSDFDFIQENRKIENYGDIVTIDGSKNLGILLNYDKVPEILKTIAVTLTDPLDNSKIFTFLLRVNKEKTIYEAMIAPLGRSGKYRMDIIVLDYKNQGLKRLNGILNVTIWEINKDLFKSCGVFDEFGNCEREESRNKIIIYIILLILLIIIILGSIFRRRDKKKESKEIHEE